MRRGDRDVSRDKAKKKGGGSPKNLFGECAVEFFSRNRAFVVLRLALFSCRLWVHIFCCRCISRLKKKKNTEAAIKHLAYKITPEITKLLILAMPRRYSRHFKSFSLFDKVSCSLSVIWSQLIQNLISGLRARVNPRDGCFARRFRFKSVRRPYDS